jgi:hypothetical protein
MFEATTTHLAHIRAIGGVRALALPQHRGKRENLLARSTFEALIRVVGPSVFPQSGRRAKLTAAHRARPVRLRCHVSGVDAHVESEMRPISKRLAAQRARLRLGIDVKCQMPVQQGVPKKAKSEILKSHPLKVFYLWI